MRISLFRRQPDPDRIEVVHAGTRYAVLVKRRAAARRMTLRVSQATGEIGTMISAIQGETQSAIVSI